MQTMSQTLEKIANVRGNKAEIDRRLEEIHDRMKSLMARFKRMEAEVKSEVTSLAIEGVALQGLLEEMGEKPKSGKLDALADLLERNGDGELPN